MESRASKAVERLSQGHNCCQAVLCNYADLINIDETIAFRVAEGFGLGVGGQKEICGAVSGMAMIAGCKISSGSVESGLTKAETRALTNQMIEVFKRKNGSIICRELLGDEEHPKLRTCDGCVEDACIIVEDALFVAL